MDTLNFSGDFTQFNSYPYSDVNTSQAIFPYLNKTEISQFTGVTDAVTPPLLYADLDWITWFNLCAVLFVYSVVVGALGAIAGQFIVMILLRIHSFFRRCYNRLHIRYIYFMRDRRRRREAIIEVQSLIGDKIDPKYLDFCLNAYILYHTISRSKHWQSWFVAIVSFLHNYYTIEETLGIIEIILEDYALENEDIEPQAFGASLPSLRSCRQRLSTWRDMNSSEIVKNTQRVMCGVLSSSLAKQMDLKFDKESYEFFLGRGFHLNPFKSANEMLFSVADLILSYCEVGYECFVRKDLRPILSSDRAITEWLDETEAIVAIHDTLPTAVNVDLVKLINRFNIQISVGASLMNRSRGIISPLWNDLLRRRSKIMRENNICSIRKPPASVLLYGPPGIGKSSVAQMIASLYQQTVTQLGIYDLTWDPRKNMYTHNAKDAFFSKYNPTEQYVILLDDLGRENVNHVAKGVTLSLDIVIEMVNSVGICTPQAAIEDKGSIPLIPKLVIATTNVKDLNAKFAVAEPAAVLRRLPIVIKPVLKPEFVDPETGTMKKLLIMEMNAWDFQVQTVKVSVGTNGKTSISYVDHFGVEPLMTGAELSKWLSNKFEVHELSSQMMLDAVSDTNVTMCKHKVLSYYPCAECAEEDEIVYMDNTIPDTESIISDLHVPDSTIVPQAGLFGIFRTPTLSRRERYQLNFVRCFLNYAPEPLIVHSLRVGMNYESIRSSVIQAARIYYARNIPLSVVAIRSFYMAAVAGSSAYLLIKVFDGMFGSMPKQTVSDESNIKEEVKSEAVEDDIQAQTNIWKAVDNNNSFIVPITSKEGNKEEIIKSIKKSMFKLSVCNGPHTQDVMAVCIGPSKYLTVNHAFMSTFTTWKCVADYGHSFAHVSSTHGFIVNECQLERLSNDLIIFNSASILPRKSLRNFLPDLPDKAGRPGITINLLSDGSYNMGVIQSHTYKQLTYFNGTNEITGFFMDGIRSDRRPVKGDCGTLIISRCGLDKHYISGMHCAGSPASNRIITSQLSQSMIPKTTYALAMSTLNDTSYYEKGSIRSGPLTEPYRKGIHHWVSSCKGIVLGSYKARSHMKSRVEPTIIAPMIKDLFNVTQQYAPALIQPKLVDGEWLNPFTRAAEQQGNISPHFQESKVMECAESYFNDVKKVVNNNNLVVFDIHTAINGIDGVDFIDSVPMNTSGGFHFPGPKRNYFLGEPGNYRMNDLLQEKYDFIKEQYLMGERACVIFQGSLKDEALPIEKVELGKTRMFTACGGAMLIITRQYFLDASRLIMENNIVFECAVGMNHRTIVWDEMFEFITIFGLYRIIAGDYSAFDKKMAAIIIRAAFWVLTNMYTSSSYSDDLIRRGIATDICYPITNFNGDLIQCFGGNSSGHPLTVIINSIANSIYIRYAFTTLGFKLPHFRSHVHLMTLGDDNIMGSNLPMFNHSTISACLASLGVPYTMADKKAESVPFINIFDADFLKRKFVRFKGIILAPLNLNSVIKSLCMHVDRDNISNEQQIAQCILAAKEEWVVHGEIIYNNCSIKINKVLDVFPTIKMFCHERVFYTYDEQFDHIYGRRL